MPGARVHVINPLDFDFNFALAGKQIVAPAAMVDVVLGLARAANDAGKLPASSTLAAELAKTSAGESAKALISQLTDASASVVILGESAVQHADAAWLRAAAKFIARATGSACNEIPPVPTRSVSPMPALHPGRMEAMPLRCSPGRRRR